MAVKKLPGRNNTGRYHPVGIIATDDTCCRQKTEFRPKENVFIGLLIRGILNFLADREVDAGFASSRSLIACHR
jgi:hypothetical protein